MGANEKHAATFYDPASGEEGYVPSVEFARGGYIYDRITLGVVDAEGAKSEFDRMIAKVRAEAKAEALHEVLTVISAEIEDAPPANYEEDNYEAGYIAGLDFLLNAKALANQYKEEPANGR